MVTGYILWLKRRSRRRWSDDGESRSRVVLLLSVRWWCGAAGGLQARAAAGKLRVVGACFQFADSSVVLWRCWADIYL